MERRVRCHFDLEAIGFDGGRYAVLLIDRRSGWDVGL